MKGGETSAVPKEFLLLRFDQPVDEAWLKDAVLVEGPGALMAHGGALGLAIIRLDGAKASDTVRVQVPAFEFDVRIQVGAPDPS